MTRSMHAIGLVTGMVYIALLPGLGCGPPADEQLPTDVAATLLDSDATRVGIWSRIVRRAQLGCQQAIVDSGRAFVRSRLDERAAGVRSNLASAHELTTALHAACGVEIEPDGDSTLPRLGAECASAIGAAGSRQDPDALAQCLRPALGRIVAEISPHGLPPNVVVIMTDDQRWDTLEYMPRVQARLARNGVTFAESFVTTSLCCPARASFLSGRQARHTRIRGVRPPLGGATLFDEQATLVVALQQSGYVTGLFGKYMNASDLLDHVPVGWDVFQAFHNDGLNYFDYVLNEDGKLVDYGSADDEYSTDLLLRRSLEFVGAHKDEPFFLLYTPYAPHFDATFFSVTPAPRHMGAHADLPPWRPASYREPDVDDKPRYLQRTQEAYWDELEASGEQDRLRIQQLESLLAVDEAVDALLDALEEAGLADDTLVVFTSDNGYMWGEHRLTGKNVAYEESIRVPLLIHHPLLVSAPRKETRLVTNLDLAPTILELADVEPTFPLDGRSLVDLLKGKEPVPPWRDAIVGDHWRIPQEGNAKPLFPHTRNFFLRSAKWKYIESRPFAVELYDLATDPLELENLAKDRAYLEQAISLRKRLNAAWSETEPDVEPTEPAD